MGKNGQLDWIETEKIVVIQEQLFSALIQAVKKLDKRVDWVRKERSTKNIPKIPEARKTYFIDEQGFLVSKEQWLMSKQ